MKILAILFLVTFTTLEASHWFSNTRHSPKLFLIQTNVPTQDQPKYDQSHIKIAWTKWSEWSPCSKTCGAGRMSRNRSKLQTLPNWQKEIDAETEFSDCNHGWSGMCHKNSQDICHRIVNEANYLGGKHNDRILVKLPHDQKCLGEVK